MSESDADTIARLRAENALLRDALAYAADCHAATAEFEGPLRRTSQSSRRRMAGICLRMAAILEGDFSSVPRSRSLASPERVAGRCTGAADRLMPKEESHD